MNKITYFDNAATTKPFEDVIALEAKVSYDNFFNPSAGYKEGINSKKLLTNARETLADYLGCKPSELYFTSCGSESNNTAVFCGYKNKKGLIVTSAYEHPSVANCILELKSRGANVIEIPIRKADAQIDYDFLEKSLSPDISFASVMHVNNECGAVNDIRKITTLIKKSSPNCIVHSDGVQAFGKIPTNVSKLGVDLYSVSAHKIHGVRGIAALYVKDSVSLKPYIYGGGQERGVRSGTENVASACSFARAAQICQKDRASVFSKITEIRNFIADYCQKSIGDVIINGSMRDNENSPFILSMSFKGIKAEILQQILADNNIYISKGSACSTHSKKSSLVSALQLPKEYAEGTVRLSFSSENTMEESQAAVVLIKKYVDQLRISIK